MNPETPLAILTALADFLLKVTFAFAIFLAFSRLINPPNRRFILWLGFLAGAATYWISLTTRAVFEGTGSAAGQQGAPYAPYLGPRIWHVPQSWSSTLSVALGGAGVLYLLVLVYFFISDIRKQVHLRWVLGFGCKPPKEVAQLFRTVAESLNVRKCRLLLLTGITSPATFGWIRPTVLLPTIWVEQDRGELEGVLRHELHHVRRRDFLLSRVAALFKALLFFHPAVWYAVKELQFERELACDLAVVSDSPARRIAYAECLVRFARINIQAREHPWGIDFAAPSNHLTARVRSILSGSKKSPKWALYLRITAATALLVGSFAILPTLAIALSYVQQQVVQRPETIAPVLHAHRLARAKTTRSSPKSTTDEPTNPGLAFASPGRKADDQITHLLASAKYPDVVYVSPKPKDRDPSTGSDSEASDSPADPGAAPGRRNKSNIKMPSITSVIMGAAQQSGGLGHDHDHDKD